MTSPVSTAIAEALVRARVTIATHVPGFGAIQTFAEISRLLGTELPGSFHEEVAFGIAHGASIAGKRAVCVIKSHGFAKATNAIMDSLSSGVTAALVVLVFEDRGGTHSDNIIDIEPLVAGTGAPHKWAETASIYADVEHAIAESERLKLPYVLMIDADTIDALTEIPEANNSHAIAPTPEYCRDITQNVVVPTFGKYQRDVLLAKLAGTDWGKVERPHIPELPTGLPPDYQRAVEPYLPIFEAFQEIPSDFVTGDTGVSTLSALPPYNIVNATTYMGGSIPLGIGATLAGFQKVWSFTGDFSFIAAGHLGLIEARLRGTPLKIIIFANGKAQTTGGQPLDLDLMENILGGYAQYVRRIKDPFNRSEILTVLEEASAAPELRIVIAEYTKSKQ
jgi:TPP-dependent indolepyruvate ferredoxin oxidoreductase alpha subunit